MTTENKKENEIPMEEQHDLQIPPPVTTLYDDDDGTGPNPPTPPPPPPNPGKP